VGSVTGMVTNAAAGRGSINSTASGPASGPSGSEVANDDVIEMSGPEHRAVRATAGTNVTNQNGVRAGGLGRVDTSGVVAAATRVVAAALVRHSTRSAERPSSPTPRVSPVRRRRVGDRLADLYANFFAYESSFRGGVYVG
jgi:hypothetical protein